MSWLMPFFALTGLILWVAFLLFFVGLVWFYGVDSFMDGSQE